MTLNGIAAFHDVLATVESKAVSHALAAFDAATAAQAAHREPTATARRAEALRALRVEHRAAAFEGRAPRLTGASIAEAEAAIIDADLRSEALGAVVACRTEELAAALTADAAHVFHAVAVARAADLRTRSRSVVLPADPEMDAPPRWLASLWRQMTHPLLAWVPAVVHFGALQRWDVPSLRVEEGARLTRSASLAAARRVWDSHVWEQMELAEGRGWRLDDDGALRLLTPWPTHARSEQPMLVDQPRPRNPNVDRPRWEDRGVDEGSLLWVGTGPNGERGATIDDIAMQTVTLL